MSPLSWLGYRQRSLSTFFVMWKSPLSGPTNMKKVQWTFDSEADMKKVQWTFDSEAENTHLNNSCLNSDNWDNLDNCIFLFIGRNLIWTMVHLRCARAIWTIPSVVSAVLYLSLSKLWWRIYAPLSQ